MDGGTDEEVVESLAGLQLEEEKKEAAPGKGTSEKALKRQRQKAKKAAEAAAKGEGEDKAKEKPEAGGPLVRVNPVDGGSKAASKPSREVNIEKLMAAASSSSSMGGSKNTPSAKDDEAPLSLKGVPQSFIPTKEPPMEEDEDGNLQQRKSAVQCTKCGLWVRSFKFMWTKKVVLEDTAVDWGSMEEEDKEEWVRNCIICLARIHNNDVPAALKLIKDCGPVKGPTKRSQAFADARENMQSEWHFVSEVAADENGKVSTKRMRKMIKADFQKLFRPWASIIALKVAQLEGLQELTGQFSQLTTELSRLLGSQAPQEQIDACMAKVDGLEALIEEKGKMLAFADKGEDQQRYLDACEYADEWLSYAGMRLRSYYKCNCGVVIASKHWKTRHADPLASQQRWYCLGCGVRYRASMGQLVELLVQGQLMWMYAAVPPKDIEDMRAMALEKEKRGVASADDLCRQINSYAPATGNGVIVQCHTGDLCSWAKGEIPQDQWEHKAKMMAKLTPAGHAALQSGARWDWMQFFNWLES